MISLFRAPISMSDAEKKFDPSLDFGGLMLKFWEGHKISRNLHLLLSYVVPVKSKVKISQNFVAFSEYMNFNKARPTKPYLPKKLVWLCPVNTSPLKFKQALKNGIVCDVYLSNCWLRVTIDFFKKKKESSIEFFWVIFKIRK